MRKILTVVCLAGVLAAFSSAKAATATFHFAPLGSSFSAALSANDPLIGAEVTSARIYLDVESFPGSDAVNFFTDITFPIEPFTGNTNGLALTGADLGWSGAGTFHYFEETTRFNGVFAPYRYGGETPGENFEGLLLETSRIEFDYIPASGGEFVLNGAVLRKKQESAGDFDIPLPLTGETGIESRGSGESRVIFTFNHAVTGAGSATATCGQAGVISVDPVDSHSLSVKLDELGCDQSVVTVTLHDAMDDQGQTLASAAVTFRIVFGDVTGNGAIEKGDRQAISAARGQTVDGSNFRADINADGQINNRDLLWLKSFGASKYPKPSSPARD